MTAATNSRGWKRLVRGAGLSAEVCVLIQEQSARAGVLVPKPVEALTHSFSALALMKPLLSLELREDTAHVSDGLRTHPGDGWTL